MMRQLLPLLLGAILAGVPGCQRKDECNPKAFTVRCGQRQGTLRACVRVDADDYLVGFGGAHHVIETIACPRTRPTCVESEGGALCSGK